MYVHPRDKIGRVKYKNFPLTYFVGFLMQKTGMKKSDYRRLQKLERNWKFCVC